MATTSRVLLMALMSAGLFDVALWQQHARKYEDIVRSIFRATLHRLRTALAKCLPS